jgi:hypothetical protein
MSWLLLLLLLLLLQPLGETLLTRGWFLADAAAFFHPGCSAATPTITMPAEVVQAHTAVQVLVLYAVALSQKLIKQWQQLVLAAKESDTNFDAVLALQFAHQDLTAQEDAVMLLRETWHSWTLP